MKLKATAKLLSIDSSARFLVFDGRGRGHASRSLETDCPCNHLNVGEPLGFILTEPAFIPQHGQKQGQWWQTSGINQTRLVEIK